MKAVTRTKYGLPKNIEIKTMENPTPNDNEVLVEVFATTVNRTDCANLTGKPFIMKIILGIFGPRKIVLGTDFAGEVMFIGKNVKSFKIGDKVFGFNDMGLASQANYMTLREDDIFKFPENMDFKQAAASLEGAHYAYSFIKKVKIHAGQNILINGASGAIGSALLQFVRQYDVKIAVTCNSQNVMLMQSLGADKVYDYTKEDFLQQNDTFDFIFDSVGKSTFSKCMPILKENGIYISSELGPYAQNLFYSLIAPISKRKVIFPIPFSTQKSIPYILNLLKTDKFNLS